VPIELAELDRLQREYKEATDRWIAAIRAEEALATPDHSVAAWEHWEQAGFKAQEAGELATTAKEAYKDGLRNTDFDIPLGGLAKSL
jgi:hypothetical protein